MSQAQRHRCCHRFSSRREPVSARSRQQRLVWLLSILLPCAGATAPAHAASEPAPAHVAVTPRLADLALPGDAAFVTVARDVIDVVFAIDPSIAANAGLFDDAVRVPSFSPASVQRLVARLDEDLAAMRAMPWRTWSVDGQIDFRWIYANAETARRQLLDERMYEHRPAAWLEPLANDLIALASYVPADKTRPARLWARVPEMLQEVRRVSTDVTVRDRATAQKLLAALAAMAVHDDSASGKAAAGALTAYGDELTKLRPTREFAVIGADNYAWRMARTLLLSETPAELLAAAQRELTRVDGELAGLPPRPTGPAEPSKDQQERAAALTRDGMLGLYDQTEVALRSATLDGGFVTIPDGVGPIHARETPDAMVPLTGDGGSMNPPPPLADTNIGHWNVEHFQADWPVATRIEKVVSAEGWQKNGMGPYAAHEGFPGHHLQLAIARLHADPIRSILPDPVQNEGWALYAEEELWSHGGFGPSDQATAAVLRSYRFRIARVCYGINIETGVWDLQQGADFQQHAEAGKGRIGEDVLRVIQWPTQLICYFAGKRQIVALKAEYRQKFGRAYSDRAFNDAFLAEGSIPVALIRAKLLGEPVPEP
jgi:hypothetical protein